MVSLLHPASARVSVQYFIHNLVNRLTSNEDSLDFADFNDKNANFLERYCGIFSFGLNEAEKDAEFDEDYDYDDEVDEDHINDYNNDGYAFNQF